MQFLIANLPMFAVITALMLLETVRNPARTDWRINLQTWIIAGLVGLIVLPVLRIAGLPALIDGAALPFWIGFPLFLLISDFGEFLFHRAQHRVPFLWTMHSLHHSDPEMSVLTTQRHFWGEQIIKTVSVWAVASIVIAPTPAMAGGYAFFTLWNFFTHARLRIDLGWWSWIINSPAYHRRHHSSVPEHYDSNFAGLFPIFDVIFGSYRRPEGFPPTGLDIAPRNAWDIVVWPARVAEAQAKAPALPSTAPAISEA